jgi:hypothetical protein
MEKNTETKTPPYIIATGEINETPPTNSTSSLQFTDVFYIEECFGVLFSYMAPSSQTDFSSVSKRFLELLKKLAIPKSLEVHSQHIGIIEECYLKVFGCGISNTTLWCPNIGDILEYSRREAPINYCKSVCRLMSFGVTPEEIQKSDSEARQVLGLLFIEKIVDLRSFAGSELITNIIITSESFPKDLPTICSKFPNLGVICAKNCTFSSKDWNFSRCKKLTEWDTIEGAYEGGTQIQLPHLTRFSIKCFAENARKIGKGNAIRFIFGHELTHL